MISVRHLVSVS